MSKPTQLILLSIFISSFWACNGLGEKSVKTSMFSTNDPFQETMVKPESIQVNADEQSVVEGAKGTVLYFPENCFKDASGKTVHGKVDIELAEALTMDDILMSNLTTTSGGAPLESGGMIFFNATKDGKQLTIDKDKPVYIEIPTADKQAGMSVYEGTRDEDGNMDWVNPKPIENFLVTVDLELLDFLPEGFEAKVADNMPFRNHTVPTKALCDSLYYSLSGVPLSGYALPVEGMNPTILVEPGENTNHEVIDGAYTDESYEYEEVETDTEELAVMDTAISNGCGIDPAMIRVLKSSKFQNTFIATREFETRLQVIFQTCNNAVLQLYVNNLDKNLWEVDQMAADFCGSSEQGTRFLDFARLKESNVKHGGKRAKALKKYFEKRLKKVHDEVKNAREELAKAERAQQEEFEKVVDEYKEVLRKREKHRMEAYGFEWTNTGWINVDKGTEPKKWKPQPLEVHLAGVANPDRAHTYLVYPSIQSLYSMFSQGDMRFIAGVPDNAVTKMPKDENVVVVAVAYKGDQVYFGTQTFKSGSVTKLSLPLKPSSMEEVKRSIRDFDKYKQENRIDVDLEYMKKFAEEKKRREQKMDEAVFMYELWQIANPCCAPLINPISYFYYSPN